MTAAVAQEDRARAHACGRGGSDDAGREQGEGTAVAQVARARQRELRWLGGGEEDEMNLESPSPPPFYKAARQPNSH